MALLRKITRTSQLGQAALLSRALGEQLRRMASSAPSSIDLNSDVTLQKARTWDEGVSSKFSASSMADIFKGKKVVIFGVPGAYTGVCTAQHVPSYVRRADELKKKGVHTVICTAVNDPYVINGWAEKIPLSKDKLEFYGDFNGAFHKSLGLEADLSGALLGPRGQRWSAYVVDGKIEALHVEESPGDFKVSDADTILKDIK